MRRVVRTANPELRRAASELSRGAPRTRFDPGRTRDYSYLAAAIFRWRRFAVPLAHRDQPPRRSPTVAKRSPQGAGAGYQDILSQSALAEIENVAAEDLANQLQESPATLRALDQAGAPADGRHPAAEKPRKQPRKKADDGAPKAATVQRCIQELIAAKGEARRNEVLGAARAENPRITGQDVHNAVRTLARRGEIRVDPEESSRLLPPEASEPAPVGENDV